jgi:hypothetical protein
LGSRILTNQHRSKSRPGKTTGDPLINRSLHRLSDRNGFGFPVNDDSTHFSTILLIHPDYTL